MSEVLVHIPDDRWFKTEWGHRPKEGQLCIVYDPPNEDYNDEWVGTLTYKNGNFVSSESLYGEEKFPFTHFKWYKPIDLPVEDSVYDDYRD